MSIRFRVFILLLLTVLFVSCRHSSVPPQNTLVVGVPSLPPTLDPRYARDSVGRNVRNLLFSSLVRLQTEGSKVAIRGDLAESWSYKNLIYHFQLRPGLKFSDGTHLTAEDIEFSIREYQKDTCPFSGAFKKIKNVQAKYDDNHHFVDIEVSVFENTFFMDLSVLKILPKKIVETHDKDFYNYLIGTGAFKLDHQNENELFFNARPDHHLAPKIKNLQLKVVRDDNTRFQKLYKGSLDIVQDDIPFSKLTIFQESPRFTVYEMPGGNTTYLLLNLRDPLLKNKDFRRALNYAIDRNEIIKYKLEGHAKSASTIALPSTEYFSSDLRLPSTDIDAGKKLIKNFPSSLQIELKTSNQKYTVENGRILSHQLEKLGLEVKHKSFEWGTYYDDITKGNFQLATMKFVGFWDPDLYRLVFHSKLLPPNGMNRGYYINPQLDALLDEGNRIQDVKKRIEHYKKIQKTIIDDLPLIPLWYDNYIAVVNNRVKNFKPSPLSGFDFVYDVEKSE